MSHRHWAFKFTKYILPKILSRKERTYFIEKFAITVVPRERSKR